MAEATAQEHVQDDRLSDLPDDILALILDKLELLSDAVKTTILSKHWRHLFGLRSVIVLGVLDHFNTTDDDNSNYYTTDELVQTNASVVEATKSILQQIRRHTIELLSITFYLRDESIGIVLSVDEAMANHKILEAEFIIIPEVLDIDCIDDDDVLANGKRFMRFLGAYPCAFGGLTDLSLHSLRLGGSDIPNVLATCKKLGYLDLYNCDTGIRSVLQIEHSELAELNICSCGFERVKLKWLPRLSRFRCENWLPSQDQYPLSFGYVPQLSTLVLSNAGTTLHKTLKLSEFLGNTIIGELHLNFGCERIWIQPESSKLLAPALRNLQMVKLYFIHEECDLTWTMFLLEAAPLLKELSIQVWDHTCNATEKDEYKEYEVIEQEIYQKEGASLKWEACSGFKHHNLRSLTVGGFQVEEKFMVYISHVMEAAVNLEVVSLLESHTCPHCGFCPLTSYPRTSKEIDQVTKQISGRRSSPIRLEFGI